jgi:hypothetical protein
MSKRKPRQTRRNIAAHRPGEQSAQSASTKPVVGMGEQGKAGSKQCQVLAMLAAPAGASIDAIMEATGWQQHSVRGFLAGVVRKKLQRDLTSAMVEGMRIYRIAKAGRARAESARPRQAKT